MAHLLDFFLCRFGDRDLDRRARFELPEVLFRFDRPSSELELGLRLPRFRDLLRFLPPLFRSLDLDLDESESDELELLLRLLFFRLREECEPLADSSSVSWSPRPLGVLEPSVSGLPSRPLCDEGTLITLGFRSRFLNCST